MEREALTALVLAGHVDHGKSSLLGRLLHELGQLPAGKAEELAALSAKRGVPLEWSFALDSFQAERDQAITLDTTRVRLKTPRREFVVIDAPGHKELLRNMVSGASAASAALLVLDARTGSEEQTLRHAYVLKMLGVRDIVVAINKMDLVDYSQKMFAQCQSEVGGALVRMGIEARSIVPVSARDGVNLCQPSAPLEWHRGPTLVGALEALPASVRETELPLRLPVQDVYRVDERRILFGRVESGSLATGDEIVFSPSGRSAKIAELMSWPDRTEAKLVAGDNASIVLDRPLIVERGDLASHRERLPKLTAVFDAEIFWLASQPLVAGRELTMHAAARTVGVRVQSIHHRIDLLTLERRPASQIAATEIAQVTLRAHQLLALDDFAKLPATGRFVLRDGFVTVGGGVIDASGYPDQRAIPAPTRETVPIKHQVSEAERSARLHHTGAVVWLTGLSAAGKSTLAMLLERRLFDAGYAVFVLDGDNVRRGLNANLGFSPEDRQENIRRVGEVAALFAEAGFVCITAFISPYRDDRRRARAALKSGRFFEVYLKADLAACEARDPKGLYRRARQGEIREFTGIDSPYEEPVAADLVIDTTARDVASCIDELLAYVVAHCRV
ncbi:MAG TPA: adenylyl-sulfate kinase [Casimicrobiaceae bacterium]|nr:adenylyl-sulfate kinase [Casimicrobiaceae bacterium]